MYAHFFFDFFHGIFTSKNWLASSLVMMARAFLPNALRNLVNNFWACGMEYPVRLANSLGVMIILMGERMKG